MAGYRFIMSADVYHVLIASFNTMPFIEACILFGAVVNSLII